MFIRSNTLNTSSIYVFSNANNLRGSAQPFCGLVFQQKHTWSITPVFKWTGSYLYFCWRRWMHPRCPRHAIPKAWLALHRPGILTFEAAICIFWISLTSQVCNFKIGVAVLVVHNLLLILTYNLLMHVRVISERGWVPEQHTWTWSPVHMHFAICSWLRCFVVQFKEFIDLCKKWLGRPTFQVVGMRTLLRQNCQMRSFIEMWKQRGYPLYLLVMFSFTQHFKSHGFGDTKHMLTKPQQLHAHNRTLAP